MMGKDGGWLILLTKQWGYSEDLTQCYKSGMKGEASVLWLDEAEALPLMGLADLDPGWWKR